STMAESWVGAFSGLSDGDDVAEYLTGTVWANLATAIDALTAPGATTKSDGGEVITAEQMDAIEKAAVAGRPLTDPDWKQDQAETTRIRLSDPSSTRSDVTVSELKEFLASRTGPGTSFDADAIMLLDQFEIRRK
ncbi:MAG: hypothetical protein J0I08_16840, partial [Rhizobiales bacterium]|nr:hypothetical protein [Hyphomicrobiales bacterium]